ncbi:hypothetical protein BKA70DRAFT_2587 [Coprinopsis sp. MPI-PUGE-AT-0042]|nr:hypothetical protein BKA70DRAFT_2587 [Coprinopsis sp. MPI-PUGE-AT-0042]
MFSKATVVAFVFASTLGLVQAAPVALSRRQVKINAPPDVVNGPVIDATPVGQGPEIITATADGPVQSNVVQIIGPNGEVVGTLPVEEVEGGIPTETFEVIEATPVPA